VNSYSKDRLDIVDWTTYADDLEDKIQKADGLDDSETKKLKTIVSKLRIGSKQGRMKLLFWQQNKKVISLNVVVDFLPTHISKVMFDGTASINDTYKLLNEHLGDDTVEKRKYHNVRSFKNATIMYYPSTTGKSSLTVSAKEKTKKYYKEVQDIKESLSNLIENTITRYGKDEAVLFIIHKDNTSYLEPLLKDTNYTYTYWGKHIGSNEWSNYNKVIVYGLNYLPETVYRAKYYSTFGVSTNLNIDSIEGFKAGLLSCDIMQGIFRGGLRNVKDDGNCSSECEVIITLPNSILKDEILSRMKSILHDSTFKEIKDGAKPINSNNVNTTKMKLLLTELKEKMAEVYIEEKGPFIEKCQLSISPSDLNINHSINLRNLLTRGSNKEVNNKLLLDNNWLYTKATAKDRKLLGIKGKSPYVFKHIGEFTVEVQAPKEYKLYTSLDINGEEF